MDTLKANGPAVGIDDCLADGKPQTDAVNGRIADVTGPEVPGESTGLVLLVHSHAGVLDVAHHRVFLLQQSDANVAAGGGVLDGVAGRAANG